TGQRDLHLGPVGRLILRSHHAHQNGQRPELRSDLPKKPANLIRLANIGLHQKSVRPELTDLFECRLCRLPVTRVVDCHPRALYRELQCDTSANTPRASRDDGMLSCKGHKYLRRLRRSMLVPWPATVKCSACSVSLAHDMSG